MEKSLISLIFLVACMCGYSQETGTVTDPRDGKVYKTVKIGEQWVMAENLAYKPETGVYCADTSYFEKDIKVNYILIYENTDFRNGKIIFPLIVGDQWLTEDVAVFKKQKKYYTNAPFGCVVFDSAKYYAKNLFDGYLVLDSTIFKKYGCLYDFETAQSSAIPGWHVPTSDELKEFYKSIDGNANEKYAALLDGGSSGFNAALSGWGVLLPGYLYKRWNPEQRAGFWTSSRTAHLGTCLDFEGPPDLREGAVRIGVIHHDTGLSVRLFKDR